MPEGSISTVYLLKSEGLLSQAVSRHVGVLIDAGLVMTRKQGREVHLSVCPEAFAPAADWLAKLGAAWDDALDRLKQQMEEDSA